MVADPVETGLARLVASPPTFLKNAKIGLVAHGASVTASVTHSVDALLGAGIKLAMLFGPEHGLGATAQYMEGVEGEHHPSGLPVRSLYGGSLDTLSPAAEDLANLDVLIIDLQDVGSRYYTFAATMALAMRVAAKTGTKIVVCDRPNPIDGVHVEGGGLVPGLENFCGLYPVPQRHGMTMGELARLYNDAFGIGCELEVIAMQRWRRRQLFGQTGLPWVMPSPGMPTCDTALVYPGMCLLEGTNISEARGTTRPFELFGAPYINARALADLLRKQGLPGVALRECAFVPTWDKHRGHTCYGLQLHVTDTEAFLPYRTGLAVVWAVRHLWPQGFAWRTDTYEFRNDVPAIDLLTGTGEVRTLIDAGASFDKVDAAAHFATPVFDAHRPSALIYSG